MAYPKQYTVSLGDSVMRDTERAYLVYPGVWFPKSQCQWRYVGCGRNTLFATEWIMKQKEPEMKRLRIAKYGTALVEDYEKVVSHTESPKFSEDRMILTRRNYRAQDIADFQALYGEYLQVRDAYFAANPEVQT